MSTILLVPALFGIVEETLILHDHPPRRPHEADAETRWSPFHPNCRS